MVFVTNRGFIEKNSLFSIKTTFTFLEKTQIRILGFRKKKRFLEKKRDPWIQNQFRSIGRGLCDGNCNYIFYKIDFLGVEI